MSERIKTLGLDLKAGSLVRSGAEIFVGAEETTENPRARAKMPRSDLFEPIMTIFTATLAE